MLQNEDLKFDVKFTQPSYTFSTVFISRQKQKIWKSYPIRQGVVCSNENNPTAILFIPQA